MSAEALRCFREAKSNLAAVTAALGSANSARDLPYRHFRSAHELAIRAVIAAKGGSPSEEKHKLVSLCESIGLWPVMPPKFKEHLIAVDCIEPDPGAAGRGAEASLEQWQERLQVAPKFLFFIENHVVLNPQILSSLTVSS
ncbi:MAG TPA: hypothetical protein VNL14_01180 [Candidatus Acidoferrales bacterium]|nr:hypothetical protein [Candidatus Acidoferrales bacterium]